ncbi:hypothetical protein D9M71_805590 [compost metagenome]|uniref:Uncharacterized protein n=1 Tax=Pseudomonas laurylsulfativorans TaxID=1943631 RepID=A0A2S3VL25_9PSED|nr:hypothetical protein [Pseudomonas laurylsulfativorans]POF40652.1 hypothetical protein B0D71_19465 [Pseudomonas laurylsulfativorans]
MNLVFPALRTPFELARNRVFPDLQSRLGDTLRVTQQADGGAEALQRFDAVADPEACYERVHC